MKLDWFIARRYLAARRKGRFLSIITWIALGGVTVGVAALIVVIAVMTGMQKDLKAKILAASAHAMVIQVGEELRMSGWRSIVSTVRQDPDVTAAGPFVLSTVMLRPPGVRYQQSADLYGLPMDTADAAATEAAREVLASLKPSASGLPPLVLGIGLATRMQLFPGDTVVAMTMENMRIHPTVGFAPVSQSFEVVGTYESGMYEFDTRNAYTTLEVTQDYLDIEETDQVSGVYVTTADPETADVVARRLQDALGVPYSVSSWKETNRSLFAALELEKLGMGLILFLIVVVAAFNIVSTLVMVVADRTREIGILKSMGMTDRGILRVFILQGTWIGIVGTALGVLIGGTVCWIQVTWGIIDIPPEVYFVDRLPVSVEPVDVMTIVAASIAIAFSATIYPALQASRLQPVEAIRHD